MATSPPKAAEESESKNRKPAGNQKDQQPETVSESSFTDLWDGFHKSVCEAQAGQLEQERKALESYSQTVYEANKLHRTSAQESYVKYLEVFHRWQAKPEETSEAAVCEAQFAYETAHMEAEEQIRRACAEAQNAYNKEVAQARKAFARAREETFREYVKKLAATWAKVDPKTIKPKTLTIAAQGMSAIAASM